VEEIKKHKSTEPLKDFEINSTANGRKKSSSSLFKREKRRRE
jgi:hypothetical protein